MDIKSLCSTSTTAPTYARSRPHPYLPSQPSYVKPEHTRYSPPPSRDHPTSHHYSSSSHYHQQSQPSYPPHSPYSHQHTHSHSHPPPHSYSHNYPRSHPSYQRSPSSHSYQPQSPPQPPSWKHYIHSQLNEIQQMAMGPSEHYPDPLHHLDTIITRTSVLLSNLMKMRPPNAPLPYLEHDPLPLAQPFVVEGYGRRKKRTLNVGTKSCQSCGTKHTPEWRRGPDGTRSLCNACGLHYAKLKKQKLAQQEEEEKQKKLEIQTKSESHEGVSKDALEQSPTQKNSPSTPPTHSTPSSHQLDIDFPILRLPSIGPLTKRNSIDGKGSLPSINMLADSIGKH